MENLETVSGEAKEGGDRFPKAMESARFFSIT